MCFVEKPDNIRVNSKECLLVAKKFEEIVRESGLEPYDKIWNKGFWRLLIYRESQRTKQILVSIVVSKKTEQNKEVEEMSQDLKQKFIDNFAAGTSIGEKGM